jgi:hypothetical protein
MGLAFLVCPLAIGMVRSAQGQRSGEIGEATDVAKCPKTVSGRLVGACGDVSVIV